MDGTSIKQIWGTYDSYRWMMYCGPYRDYTRNLLGYYRRIEQTSLRPSWVVTKGQQAAGGR